MNLKATIPLLPRVVAFFGTFVLLSGVIGPRIISSDILYRDYFYIYGALGKALLFAGIAFLLLVRDRPMPKLAKWQPKHLGWATGSVVAFIGAWLSVSQLIQNDQSITWVLAAHVLLLSSVTLAFLACFGRTGSLHLARHFKQQLAYAAGAGAGFYVMLTGFYASWKLLAGAVLHSVRWLLEASQLHVAVIPPQTLLLDKFGVTIAQTCSGVESLALFTGLYIIVGLLDWHKLNTRKFLFVFPAALAGLFIFNILRVYLLIVGGYYINPELAFSLFHTYAGMIFFIIYALIFWRISYRWMLCKGR